MEINRSTARTLAVPAALTFAALAAFAPSLARATPRALPFTYPYATLPEGELELEQFTDVSLTRARDASSGSLRSLNLYQLQTEIEYGISDRLELGLYVVLAPNAGPFVSNDGRPSFPDGNAIKQRLRLRLAEAGDWPVDVSLYGELTEAEQEVEIEAKVNLERDFGPLQLVANLWVEREYYYDGHADTVFNPTAGATVAVTPLFHPGVEYWMRAEVPDSLPNTPYDNHPKHYLGPAVMLDFGKLWWSTAVYMRLNDTSRPTGFNPNDLEVYGHFWLRTVVGLNF